MKLWQKNYKLNNQIEKFTVGNDFLLDKALVKYDCIASIAHAKMLNKIGILNKKELELLTEGLNEIIKLNNENKFEIKQEDEDCHTAIENFLIKKYGEVGKKIHAARSRNDQVLTALRLYEKDELLSIKKLLKEFKIELDKVIEAQGSIKIPGYTHMQKAMPTDIKTWLSCFIYSADDNLLLLESVYKLIDQSPLGTAAGFGVPVIEIDREMTSKLLNFSKVMENPIYCQMSRGKFEATILHLLSQIMFDLNKLSTDLLIFSTEEFGYVSLPAELCTGSSIMPQKKNPDVLELIRANYHVVLGESFKVSSMIGSLMSGYNRDMQLTKEPLIRSIEITKDCLGMIKLIVCNIKFDKDKCKNAMTKELFATEQAYKLVQQGTPFREAYSIVSKEIK